MYVAHGEYGYELGEINFGSEVQIETNMEEKAMLQQTAVTSLRVHIISPRLHCSELGCMQTPRAALPAKESTYDREVGTMERSTSGSITTS